MFKQPIYKYIVGILGIVFLLYLVFPNQFPNIRLYSRINESIKAAVDKTNTGASVSSSSNSTSNKNNNSGYLVKRVVDGDTIELENGDRVRYIGIDTPESVDPRMLVQCFGKEAAKRNSDLVLGKKVELVKDITDRDKYGRLLRYVYIGDKFINLELIKEGYAKAYTYPPDVKYSKVFSEFEKRARESNQGLWKVCSSGTSAQATLINTQDLPQNGCNIKGNISSNDDKIFHLQNCPYYSRTKIDLGRGEKYFCTETEALAAGWRKALNCL
ncbi:MAG: Micrococcal nuclease-like protein nuclease [Candidatus Nomurabacteria bacterium GW2011_GWB1_37_5]|uniref:Micrococcal nuclease-like protein nuclease n=1 Tax=Candidatus Nomurabacteria bacterium GW2011_GWB1_37_5 TaxID=1618742 RepID=A0A0G0K1J0_9BACT|nr:MAG: Micrococcal nuclease-like protein nuclease [Candidatus Nomurabacteria bacterium GW2011_GWB1_37_5]